MILVTGGRGVIGSALLSLLDDLDLHYISLTSRYADLSQCKDVTSLVNLRPHAIVHLAAAVPGKAGRLDDDKNANITRRIDKNVLRAAAMWSTRLVYASGCSLYDSTVPGKKTEDSALQHWPPSPYLRAKLDGEKAALAYQNSIVLRISAPLANNLPNTVVAMKFVRSALEGKTLQVLGSGSRQQNYVDARDIASCILRSVSSSLTGAFNVAADDAITMSQLACEIVECVGGGRVIQSVRSDPQEGKPADYSNEKSRRLLGWSPAYSIKESIETMAGALRASN